MTTSSYFKQNLLEIEQKLRELQDTDQNSIKIRMDVMTDLYCVLHSKQAVTYFMSIYRRTGAHNATIAKDIEDYISEAWTESFRCYDPNKGALLPFLAIRIQNKIIDDERKMGGMVGLPRNGQERAKLNFISVDQDNAAAGTQDTKQGILDDYCFRRYNGEEVLENELRDLLVSKWLHSLAATILQFENKYPLQTWKELEIDHLVNVILSLAYTYLTREACSILEAESFEPYLGFLHGIRYGRKSLALDLVEEFRQPVVDRLVLMLFNKHMLGVNDFESSDDGRVILTEDGYKIFCREYERWMTGRNSNAGDPSFRNRIKQQAAVLRKTIQKNEEYVPFSL